MALAFGFAGVRILLFGVGFAGHLLHNLHDAVGWIASPIACVGSVVSAIDKFLFAERAAGCLVGAACVSGTLAWHCAIALEVEGALHGSNGREAPAAAAL